MRKSDATVAALCVHAKTVYREIPGVEVYDKTRDVRSFQGGMPVVCHPPCRAWSAAFAHMVKPEEGEAELALLCVNWLRKCGGVLEHPARSRLFAAANLPKPGRRRGDLQTLEVWQSWWGYSIRKPTWLCLSGIDPHDIHLPFRLSDHRGDQRRFKAMSRQQRSATCRPFAEWLVNLARVSHVGTEALP